MSAEEKTCCEQTKEVFYKYAGPDGLMDKDECKKMMMEELGIDCEKVPPQIKAKMMSKCGADPDKKVSWEEFKDFMTNMKEGMPEMAQCAQQRLQKRFQK